MICCNMSGYLFLIIDARFTDMNFTGTKKKKWEKYRLWLGGKGRQLFILIVKVMGFNYRFGSEAALTFLT